MSTPARPRFGRALHLGLPLALASVLAFVSAARALTLGALAPPGLGGCSGCDVFQRRDGSAASYRVPQGKWTITSWSTQGGGGAPGQARLRVYRPTQAGQFKLVKQSRLRSIPANGSPSFSLNLAVRGGDRIGLEVVNNLVSAYGVSTGGKVTTVSCEPALGQLVGPGTGCSVGKITDEQANVLVELAPR